MTEKKPVVFFRARAREYNTAALAMVVGLWLLLAFPALGATASRSRKKPPQPAAPALTPEQAAWKTEYPARLKAESEARAARRAELLRVKGGGGSAEAQKAVSALGDEDPHVRGQAAVVLGKSKDPQAFETLKNLLTSPDDHARWGAVEGLLELGDKRAVPELIKALEHPEKNTRWKAAIVLGRLGDRKARAALVKAQKDQDPFVRQAAAEALQNLGYGK